MQKCVIFVEKNPTKVKIIKKLDIIAILQVNVEVQHIVCLIWNLICPMKSLWFFVTVQTMIIMLS